MQLSGETIQGNNLAICTKYKSKVVLEWSLGYEKQTIK